MEITKELNLTDKQRAQMELHSFLNVLNILMGELELIRLDLDQPDSLPQTCELADAVLAAVKEANLTKDLALRLASIGFYFAREVDEALSRYPEADENAEIKESISNVNSIITVLTVRLQEYFERLETGLNWTAHSVAKLTENFRKFFAAVEKNSKGRYHIVFNVAARDTTDYLVNFDIAGPDGSDSLLMPPVMQDVFRDLIANARKYTPMGGEINAGLLQNERELRLVVEDNGCGIPEAEIDSVVDFGYRAVGSQGKKTQGGGFGLTKAYANTRQLGGRMWIESEESRGTRIFIRIPLPEKT